MLATKDDLKRELRRRELLAELTHRTFKIEEPETKDFFSTASFQSSPFVPPKEKKKQVDDVVKIAKNTGISIPNVNSSYRNMQGKPEPPAWLEGLGPYGAIATLFAKAGTAPAREEVRNSLERIDASHQLADSILGGQGEAEAYKNWINVRSKGEFQEFKRGALYGKTGQIILKNIGTAAPMLQSYYRAAPYAFVGASTAMVIAAVAGQIAPGPEELLTVPAAGQLTGEALIAVGAKIGLTAGTAEYWYRQGLGDFYGEMLLNGVDPKVGKIVAGIAAIPYAAIEYAQIRELTPGMRKNVQQIISRSVTQVLADVTKQYGKTLVWEAIYEEVSQEAINIAAVDLASYFSGQNIKFDKEAFIKRGNRLAETGIEAIKSMALLPVGNAAVDIAMGIPQALPSGAKTVEEVAQNYDNRIEKAETPQKKEALETLKVFETQQLTEAEKPQVQEEQPPAEAKQPWEMTREELQSDPRFILDTEFTDKYIARVEPDGRIRLSSEFPTMNTDIKRDVIKHEFAHPTVDKTLMKDTELFWKLTDSGLFGRYDEGKQKWVANKGFSGRNVNEAVTQAVADYLDNNNHFNDTKYSPLITPIIKAVAEGTPISSSILKDVEGLADKHVSDLDLQAKAVVEKEPWEMTREELQKEYQRLYKIEESTKADKARESEVRDAFLKKALAEFDKSLADIKEPWQITTKELEVPGAIKTIPKDSEQSGGARIAMPSARTKGSWQVSHISADIVLGKAKPLTHVEFETKEGALEYLKNIHKKEVQEATKQGKLVPREVLEEYKSEPWAQEALAKPPAVTAQKGEGKINRYEGADTATKETLLKQIYGRLGTEVVVDEDIRKFYKELKASFTPEEVKEFKAVTGILDKRIAKMEAKPAQPKPAGKEKGITKGEREQLRSIGMTIEQIGKTPAEELRKKLKSGKKKFQADPTVEKPTEGEAGFAGVAGRPQGKTAESWLDDEKVKSLDPEMEAFFQRTKKFGKGNASSLLEKAKAAFKERFQFTPHVPNIPEAALAKDIIRTMPERRRAAIEEAYEHYRDVLDGDGSTEVLSKTGLDLYAKKIFVEDFIVEAEVGREVPGGFTLQQLQDEKARLDDLIEKVPSVRRAYEARQALWNAVSKDLADRGVITQENAENPHYVRHFVLEYMEKQQAYFGKRKKLKEPFRAYKLGRKGTLKDVSTDILEVDTHALAQIYADNAVEDAAQEIAGKYAVKDKKSVEGEDYVEWWYKRPNVWYRATTLDGSKLAQMLEDAVEEDLDITIPKTMLREALVMGHRRKGWIIPRWLANQLDDLPVNKRSGYVVDSLTKPFTKWWKRWILRVNPIRYNRRNFTGDSERVYASGRTHAFLRAWEAIKILWNKEGEIYDKARELGVIGTSLWHEMGTAHQQKMFDRYKKVKDSTTLEKIVDIPKTVLRPISAAGQGLQDLTQAREDILRLAVFLDALEDIDNFAAGKKTRYGEHIRHWPGRYQDIEAIALEDRWRAAAKISRETLGDYGNFTPWENDVLRQGVMPFYSWAKINTTFWPHTMKEAAKEGVAGKPVVAMGMKGGMNLGKWAVRIMLFYAAAYAWNRRDEDEEAKEDALPEWIRSRPHLNVGDGTLWEQTALSDFTEWFNLDNVAGDMQRFDAGYITFEQLLKDTAVNMAQGPANKIVQGLNPFLKAPITMLGHKTFPEVFKPRQFAEAFSSKAMKEACLEVLGTDVRKFVQAHEGKVTLEEAISYYLVGSMYRDTSPEELENQIKKALSYTTLKSKSPTTGRRPGQAKKGREREHEILRARQKSVKKIGR